MASLVAPGGGALARTSLRWVRERAGNAAGTIPAWEGGIAKRAAGYKKAAPTRSLRRGQAALYDRRGQHREIQSNLTAGQMALLKKYPTWKMNVYPTRRSAAFPRGALHGDDGQCARGKLVAGGNGVTGTKGGIPFPIAEGRPGSDLEPPARYRGDTYAMNWSQAAVTRDGAYTLVVSSTNTTSTTATWPSPREREDNKLFYFLQNDHRAGAARRTDPAGARIRRSGEAAAPGVDLQSRPAARAPRA